jgi:hypothetical protein
MLQRSCEYLKAVAIARTGNGGPNWEVLAFHPECRLANDEAFRAFLDGPRRREAARSPFNADEVPTFQRPTERLPWRVCIVLSM